MNANLKGLIKSLLKKIPWKFSDWHIFQISYKLIYNYTRNINTQHIAFIFRRLNFKGLCTDRMQFIKYMKYMNYVMLTEKKTFLRNVIQIILMYLFFFWLFSNKNYVLRKSIYINVWILTNHFFKINFQIIGK